MTAAVEIQTSSRDSIRAALAHIPPHDRDQWLRIGMAVKSELGDDGFDLWDEWSQQDETYRPADAHAVWKSINECGRVTIGTLYHEAQRRGFKFSADVPRPSPPTAAEIAERERRAKQQKAKEDRQREAAAHKALALWNGAKPVNGHPYIALKGIKTTATLREIHVDDAQPILGYRPKAGGELLEGRLIVAPVKIGNAISTVELIDEVGRKAALFGGKKACGFWATRTLPEGEGNGEKLLIAEGVATALSASDATGHCALAALSCNNLAPVAKAIRARYPGACLVILADVGNGQADAEGAAAEVGGLVALPDFGGDRPEGAKDFNDLAVLQGAAAVRRCIDAAAHVGGAGPPPTSARSAETGMESTWPLPTALPSALPPVKPFCDLLLPKSLRGWIMDIADRTQCPPDFAAAGAMVALGSVIGRKVGIRPKLRDDWQECPNMWGAIVGPPSVLKSSAIREALAPLRRLEAKAIETFNAERGEWETKKAAAKVRRSAAKQNALKDARKGNSFDSGALVADDAGDEPKPRRYVVNDSTPEALCEVLRANPNGVLAHRDELAGLIRQLDREGFESARAFYLSAYSGNEPYVEDRIGRGTNLRIEAVCVSILGTIQPSIIGELLSEAIRNNGGDGFLSRFSLLVWPDVSPDWKDIDRWPDTDSRRRAFETFSRLDALDTNSIEAALEEGKPPFLRLSEPAREAFTEWRAHLERALRDPDGEHPALVAHLGKYRKLAPALALVCHLADDGSGDVTEEALIRALAWTEYLQSHARRAYASAQQGRMDSARSLLRRIERGDVPNPFTRRDVHNKGWSCLATADAVEAAAEALADFDWLRPETVPTGGRPKTLYWINPRTRP